MVYFLYTYMHTQTHKISQYAQNRYGNIHTDLGIVECIRQGWNIDEVDSEENKSPMQHKCAYIDMYMVIFTYE